MDWSGRRHVFRRLVAFSCNGRGFCPSCSARQMAEHTAHLVDRVFPPVAVRQWVLSLPVRVRYLLAWYHDLCRAFVAIFLRTVRGFLRSRARHGGVAEGRSGAVAIVQRQSGTGCRLDLIGDVMFTGPATGLQKPASASYRSESPQVRQEGKNETPG